MKIICLPAMCLSLCSCGTANLVDTAIAPVSVAFRTLDCVDIKNNENCILRDKSKKKSYRQSGQRYSVQSYSKPQRLVKPSRLYGDVRSGW